MMHEALGLIPDTIKKKERERENPTHTEWTFFKVSRYITGNGPQIKQL